MKKSICLIVVGLLLLPTLVYSNAIVVQADTSVNDMDFDNNGIIDIYDIVKISKAIGTEVLSDNTIITGKFIDENFKNAVYVKLVLLQYCILM